MNEDLKAARDLAETLRQHGSSDRAIHNILEWYGVMHACMDEYRKEPG